jgi:hypothetical protein
MEKSYFLGANSGSTENNFQISHIDLLVVILE